MSEQKTLDFDNTKATTQRSSKLTCLGMIFENDEERRNYFTEKLREKLQDPEFRKIEGFPIGSDEDILALSDPPYYTACPNPWIANFIKEWESQKPEKPADYKYHREPFAADVSEGKNDPIYNAHSYHTKVPHKAIMQYILHYTEPGDIVFDGFCGTGMTGVAAQMCGDRSVVESLGYQVKPDGTIMQQETDEEGKTHWVPFSKLGVRRTILNDLSPAATFIASSLNGSIKAGQLDKSLEQIIYDVQNEYGWMYKTAYSDGKNYGEIAYTIWSDVLICPSCQEDLVFWDVAVDKELGEVKSNFNCPKCNSILKKADCPKKMESSYDQILGSSLDRIKQVPVLIEYYVGKRKYTKIPDALDFERLRRIEEFQMPDWIPTVEMIKGERFFKDAFKLVSRPFNY